MLDKVDLLFLCLSLLASAGIGVYQGIKGLKATPQEYMMGGRNMRPLPLAMSLMVGTVSAISIMGHIGEMYTFGTQMWLMDVGLALGMVFVAKCFIPIFFPLQMVSLYQYIEERFGSRCLRRGTVLLTMIAAYFFVGVLLVPPSIFLEEITQLDTKASIAIMGLSCSIYSAFGGVKAVVYADVFQSIVMLIGILTIIIQGASNVGGLPRAWDIAYHHGRIELFNFDLSPMQRHSFWLVIFNGFFFSLCTYGVNQSQTQRAFSTSSIKKAQKVIYVAAFGMVVIRGLINLAGVVVFSNYAHCDPLTIHEKVNNIKIIVFYVNEHLTKIRGLSGLFVASIYAAVLSSVSTQVNSMTALLWEDFLKPLSVFSQWSEVKVAWLQKLLVFLTGVVGILLSFVVSNFNAFLYVVFQITGAVWGPMVGLFIVAVALPWVKCQAASIGFISAIVVSMTVVLGQLFTQPQFDYLPSNHDGCPNNITNKTELQQTQLFQQLQQALASYNTTLAQNHSLALSEIEKIHIPLAYPSTQPRGVGLFGVSYCLNYFWGFITCVLTALVWTALTSSNRPGDVGEHLILPICNTFFTKGLKKTCGKKVYYYLCRKKISGKKRQEERYSPEGDGGKIWTVEEERKVETPDESNGEPGMSKDTSVTTF